MPLPGAGKKPYRMLSIPDMALLGAAALMFFGPEQLPKVARKVGLLVRDVQNTSQSFIREMERAGEDHDYGPDISRAHLIEESVTPGVVPVPYEPAPYDPAPYEPAVHDAYSAEPYAATPYNGEHERPHNGEHERPFNGEHDRAFAEDHPYAAHDPGPPIHDIVPPRAPGAVDYELPP